ncbi:MAG: AMP-dependent synthetase/ligase [Myxococcota bacterium]
MSEGSPLHGTLLELFRWRVRQDPDREATRHLRGDKVVSTTWGEWERRSRTLAAGLAAMGLQPGQRVAILSSTRVEWAWQDLGVMMAGGITVPIFPTEVAEGCAWQLRDAGVRVVFVEDPVQARKLVSVRDRIPSVERVVWMERQARGADGAVLPIEEVAPADDPWLMGFEDFRDLGEGNLASLREDIERRSRAVSPGDCATITYTPGTEGREKGVMLTHRNFKATSRQLSRVLPVGPDDLQLLYLPLAQAFARISLVVSVEAGAVTAFARSYRTVIEDCRTFEPTFFCGVPRLFEKVRARLEAERRSLPWLQRWAMDRVLDLTAPAADGETERDGVVGRVRKEVAERLLYGPLHEVFGRRLRYAISGGAPLGEETGLFFRQHGLEVLEGYGMTETCACTHMSRLQDNVPGTAGTPLPEVEWRLLEDGELLVRGPNVFPGYWNNPQATGEALDDAGWLHTGDLARVDEDERLVITARKRDVIVTASGKVISPSPIVDALRADPLVDQALVHGEGRNFLSALITLDREELGRFAGERGLQGSYEDLTRDPKVFEEVERIVDRVNEGLPSHEHVRKFAILTTELTEEQGELTPTRRIRRRVATERHRALLDSFYSEQY